MAATIDFASLSLQDALDLAILVEEEAQERYLEFVDQMEQHHTQEAARFFASMAKNEQKHGEELHVPRNDKVVCPELDSAHHRGERWPATRSPSTPARPRLRGRPGSHAS